VHFGGHAQFGIGNRGASLGKKRLAPRSAAAGQVAGPPTMLTACHASFVTLTGDETRCGFIVLGL